MASHENVAMKLAYLTNIPSPYRIAMMEAWASELEPLGIELSTYYTDKGDQGRGWTVRRAEGLREIRLETIVQVPGYGRLNSGLLSMIRENDLVMIGGFEQASYLAAAFLARVMGRKVILLFDGFSPARMAADRLHVHLVKRLTAFLCDRFFANGRAGGDFLTDFIGVDRRHVFNQYLSVPTVTIEGELEKGLSRDEWRERLGLPPERVIATLCGYLIERKRPDLAIEAVSRLPAEQRPLLLFVGRGPLEDELVAQARRLGVDILLAGFHEGTALAQYYLASDFLVLPSRDDAWGLVVNEAMAAGLPVICSDACGARLDLVLDGVTGWGFRSGDTDDFAEALSRMLLADREKMGVAARAAVAKWTPRQSARSLVDCIGSLPPPA